jgi:hypothetical protein
MCRAAEHNCPASVHRCTASVHRCTPRVQRCTGPQQLCRTSPQVCSVLVQCCPAFLQSCAEPVNCHQQSGHRRWGHAHEALTFGRYLTRDVVERLLLRRKETSHGFRCDK